MAKYFMSMMTQVPGGGETLSGAEKGKLYGEHGTYLKSLEANGSLVFAGYTMGANPGEFSTAVFASENLSAAEKVAYAAPMVAAGLLHAEVKEFGVFVARAVP